MDHTLPEPFLGSGFVPLLAMPARGRQAAMEPVLGPALAHSLELLQETDDTKELETQVWALLSALYPKRDFLERRREGRYPFPYLVHLTPVGADGETPQGETLVVVGKHLSRSGLGFYHQQPLPHRRMIVSLQSPAGGWLAFLIDLSWCRFTRQGWYESGGRFIRLVESPLEQDA